MSRAWRSTATCSASPAARASPAASRPIAARYYAIGDPPPVPNPPAPPVVVPTSPGGGTTGGGTTTTTGGTKTTGGGLTQVTTKKKTVVKRCIVPKVTGKALNKARATVLSKGCKVSVVYKKSHKKKGTVLSSQPQGRQEAGLPRAREADDRQAVLSTTL